MPGPLQNMIETAPTRTISVGLEPALTAVYNLVLLWKSSKGEGFSSWVYQTAAELTSEQKRINDIVVNGLHFAIIPEEHFSSFPAYVDFLAVQEPVYFQNKLLNAYSGLPLKNTGNDTECSGPPTIFDGGAPIYDVDAILSSFDTFVAFLLDRFPAEHIDMAVEAESYRYLCDPPTMQTLIVTHFQNMWDRYLAEDWQRSQSLLQASIDACNQLDLSTLTKLEAAERITGNNLSNWKTCLDEIDELILTPSAHIGPYVSAFRTEDKMWVLFGAQAPQGVQSRSAELSRNEILMRLNALADDTRLRILQSIAVNEELPSSTIIENLELSQSAASRHLKQLSATGFLNESRHLSAKHYRINTAKIEDTLQALKAFLSG